MTDQRDLESALHRDWRALREAERFHGSLPSCRTKQWVREDGHVGYVTLDYRLRRDFTLPAGQYGAFAEEPFTFVEQYWSVRTMNGRQDPNWRPILNLHVVHLRARRVTGHDVEAVVRNALLLRHAASRTAPAAFLGNEPRASLNVIGLVLGTELAPEVSVVGATDGVFGIPFRAASFTYTVADGFAVQPSEDDERFLAIGTDLDGQLAVLGEQLVGDDLLPAQGYVWSGVNDGPVFDRMTNLTIHNGQVL